jgi:hypothetical protein
MKSNQITYSSSASQQSSPYLSDLLRQFTKLSSLTPTNLSASCGTNIDSHSLYYRQEVLGLSLPSPGGQTTRTCIVSSFPMINNQTPLLQIRPINLHTSQLRLNLPNPIFLFMRCCVTEGEIHVFQRLHTLVSMFNSNVGGNELTHLSSRLGNKEIGESACEETECREEDVGPPFDACEHVGGY